MNKLLAKLDELDNSSIVTPAALLEILELLKEQIHIYNKETKDKVLNSMRNIEYKKLYLNQ